MDYINIGSVPNEEPCVAVGSGDYEGPMQDECEVFRRMLQRMFPPPAGSSGVLLVRRHGHEFGPYYEVEAGFESGDVEAAEWAFGLEANVPVRWDTIAAFELQWVLRCRAIEKEEQRPRAKLVQWPAALPGLPLAELLALNPLPAPAASRLI